MRTPEKSSLIEKYINDHIDQEFEPKQIAQATNCTVQSVYLYIRKNAQRFTRVKRGVFKINASNKQTFLNNQSTI
jgi:predicted DNA-binding protein YlxM (UPF0122 family)